ncbi:hypothetical protein C8F04DRAFT_1149193, partial [Mycena alexandri]
MTDTEAALVPYTDQECPRVRILVVGKSGAGKSALINAVFGVAGATAVSHRTPGKHDINKPLSFPENDRIIIHDSQGFEAGEEVNIEKVFEFIDSRSKMSALADQLHAIWVCAEIPFAGSRLFEAGVEQLLTRYCGIFPIVVVFTKLDILREKWLEKLEHELGEEMNDKEFDDAVDAAVEVQVQKLCVEPLRAMSAENPLNWIATSTGLERRFKTTITDLIELVLKLTNIEKMWIEMAIAQRSNAKASIEASIKIGRKRYWRGLLSDIFLGQTMRRVLGVLLTDIVNVWNMDDPENHLKKPEFLALLSVLVEDLSDEPRNNYELTDKAMQAIINNPASIIVAGPTAVVILFAEWVRGTYRKTKGSLRCLVAFLVDLTLTMDTLFYLVLSRKSSMTVGLVNQALRIYKTRKGPVHNSIKTWADGWGVSSHLDAEVVIQKITDIIADNSIQPELWEMKAESADEAWMTVEALRET